jgi:hypothetical protein
MRGQRIRVFACLFPVLVFGPCLLINFLPEAYSMKYRTVGSDPYL